MAIKFTQSVDLTNQRLVNLGSPSATTDAANKAYVDNVAQGLDWKQSVRAATTSDTDLGDPGGNVIDGVALSVGDRFLVKDQATASENGIYIFNGPSSATPATRATDADTSADINSGLAVSVEEGTVNGDKTFVLVTNNPITLGTTGLTFTLMNGGRGPDYTAGNGITFNGSAIEAKPAVGGGIVVASAGVSVDPAVVVRKFAANVGDGASTTISLNHNLNTLDVNVQVFNNGNFYDTVFCEVQRVSLNQVQLVFGTAPAANAYRAVVHG